MSLKILYFSFILPHFFVFGTAINGSLLINHGVINMNNIVTQQAITSLASEYKTISNFLAQNSKYASLYERLNKIYLSSTDISTNPRANGVTREQAKMTARKVNADMERYAFLMVPIPDSPKEWTPDDLTILATTYAGVRAFKAIVSLRTFAVSGDKVISLDARKKLMEIKPQDKSLVQFVTDIDNVNSVNAKQIEKIYRATVPN